MGWKEWSENYVLEEVERERCVCWSEWYGVRGVERVDWVCCREWSAKCVG